MRTIKFIVFFVLIFCFSIFLTYHFAFSQEFTLDANTVGLWHFNEGSGTIANDASGNGNHGQVNGANWIPNGKFGNALGFDGVDDVVSTFYQADFGTSPFTVEGYFKTSSTQGMILMGNYSGDARQSGFFISINHKWGPGEQNEPGMLAFFIRDNDNVGHSQAQFNVNYNDGNFHYFVAIRDNSSQMYLYVDNILRATSNAGNKEVGAPPNDNNFGIGRCSSEVNYAPFEGVIDEVRISDIERHPALLTNLQATKEDVFLIDIDNDGFADPNDKIRYTVILTNTGNFATQNAVFNDIPDANTSLVVGSVTTTKGIITSGNGAGDTNVTIDIDDISSGGGSVTITFDVIVNAHFPSTVTQLCNQGLVTGDNFNDINTDDPATGQADDPTCTLVDDDFDDDGISNVVEGESDRDNDNVPNHQDYDPTGYFYDEADAKIIAGGKTNVTGPGVITIIKDGSSGYYQFLTDGTAGIYTVFVTLPPAYLWSSNCTVTAGALDPTGQPNPYIIGNSENGNTGFLTSNACTKFYLQFDLEQGDPFIINNNFPLTRQQPTNIVLTSFYAEVGQDGILTYWTTESEPNIAGFNIYRSNEENGEYSKINESMIPAQGNATTGASYSYTDKHAQEGDYYYKLQVVSLDGTTNFHGPVFLRFTSVEIKQHSIPENYSLSQNYPNPFNPETEIRFDLPEPAHVKFLIFNTLGQKIKTLAEKEFSEGSHTIRWDGTDDYGNLVSDGLYLCRMQTRDFQKTMRMLFLK
ncbi:DUF11 domain-containing protein [candidate division KSB1 bacterium]|nr:DUF11 domain-containing protein [candidate division KSB1 bacterium]